MAINYNDSRFTAVEEEKQQALNNVNNTYNSMIDKSDTFYQNYQNLYKDYETTQKELQQQQSDLTIEKINVEKEQAEQDYIKEQKASYVDYKKATDEYGVNAEYMASRGLTGSGYAESSRVSMYNTYQNRYATARETYNRAVTNYNLAIKDAQIANSSALAEISFNSMQKQLELALQGFQYKNTLLQAQLNAQNETSDRYYARWQDVQNQINTENALAEQKRQFDQQMAFEREQYNWQKQQAAVQNSIARAQAQAQAGGNDGSGGGNDSIDQSNSITTAFYSGPMNPDANGGKTTFSNGYQPDNVNGSKLKSTGKTITVKSKTLQGTSVTTKQNIWKDENGKKWVWDGTQNKYIAY